MNDSSAAYVDAFEPALVIRLAERIARMHALSGVLPVGFDGRRPDPSALATRANSVLVCDLGEAHSAEGDSLAPILDASIDSVPVAILISPTSTTQAAERLDRLVERFGGMPTFEGLTMRSGGESARVVVLDRIVRRPVPGAGDKLNVLAIVTAYNEADIVATTIESLLAEGIGVHLIDNWSTDGTYEIAQRFVGAAKFQLERFPVPATSTYDWHRLLRRVEEIGEASSAEWVVHHDTDERRRSPWKGIALRDALWAVQESGFNAVDHTVLNFRPIDDGFKPSMDPEQYFRHFEFGDTSDLRLQIKAWSRPGERVDIASSGGHEASFPERRVFPYRFLLKHYPIRSQAQGERKIFRERIARWNPEERRRGWHTHYDRIRPGHKFLRSVEGLTEFTDDTYASQLPVIIGGTDVAWAGGPGTLRGGATARSLPSFLNPLLPLWRWVRRTRIGRLDVADRAALWLKKKLGFVE